VHFHQIAGVDLSDRCRRELDACPHRHSGEGPEPVARLRLVREGKGEADVAVATVAAVAAVTVAAAITTADAVTRAPTRGVTHNDAAAETWVVGTGDWPGHNLPPPPPLI
jgi:hypothetical protein